MAPTLRRIALLTVLLVRLDICSAAEWVLTGRIESADGDPVAAATIALHRMETGAEAGRRILASEFGQPAIAAATSGTDGWFELTAPAAGFWRARIDAKGFAPVQSYVMALTAPRVLERASLVRAVPLGVEIVGPDGEPIAGAPVFGSVEVSEYSREPWRPARQQGVADGRGRVVFRGPPDASFEVAAWSSEHGLVTGSGRSPRIALEAASVPPRRVLAVDDRGRAAADVLVQTKDGGWPLGTTDARGRLSVQLAHRDATEIVLSSESSRGTALLEAVDEEPPVPLTVEMTPLGTVTGRVLDRARRDPVGGAIVWAMGASLLGRPVESGADGAFALAGLPVDGEWMIAALAPGYALAAERRPDRHPGAIADGAVDGTSITLGLRRGSALSGQVTGPDGAPVTGVRIEAEIDFSRHNRRVHDTSPYAARYFGFAGDRGYSDARGRFQLPSLYAEVPYRLEVLAEGYPAAEARVSPLAPGEHRTGLSVALDRGVRLSGIVLGTEGAAVGGADVLLFPASGRGGGFIRRPPSDAVVSGTTGVEGTFVLEGVGRGRLDLEVRAAGYAPLERLAFSIEPGRSEHDLGLLEMLVAAPVRGVVVDPVGAPMAGVAVIAIQSELPAEIASYACRALPEIDALVTDGGGTFELLDLAPGAGTTIVACHEGFAPGVAPGVRPPTSAPITIRMEQPAAVAGRVVDADGRGIAGASVRYEGASGRGGPGLAGRGESDGGGRYRLAPVPAGAGAVIASSQGYQPSRVSVELTPGEEVEDVVVELRVGAILTGRVLDPQGRGVADASVGVVEGGRGGGYGMSGTTTDVEGRFRLNSVPTGTQIVRAEHEEYAPVSREVEIEVGENRAELELETGGRVAGRVLDMRDTPIAGAEVHLSGADDRRSVLSGADGAFEIRNVRGGRVRVTARYERKGSDSVQVAIGDPSTTDLVLRVGGEGVVVGRLIGVGPTELARVEVWASSGSGHTDGSSLGDGRYRVEGLAPGSWRIQASIERGSRQATGVVEVADGASEQVLDLDFDEGLELTGAVLSGTGAVAGATVELTGIDVRAHHSATSDAEGRFRIGNLAPGRYRVFADAVDGSASEEVDIESDASVTLEIVGGTLSGTVLDAATGEPIAGASIEIEPVERLSRYRARSGAVVDSRGYFRVDGVSGEVIVTAAARGYGQRQEIVDVPSGGREQVEFELDPTEGIRLQLGGGRSAPGSLHVAITDLAGQRLFDQRVQLTNEGRGRVDYVPEGSWRLLADAEGNARAIVPVQVPAPQPVVLSFVPEAQLTIEVPELAESPTVATIVLIGPDGLAFEPMSRYRPAWQLHRGAKTIANLPAGAWQFRVTTPDGRSWAGSATTTPGETTEVKLDVRP